MNTVHLDPAMVPAHLRGGYTGKRYQAIIASEATIPSHAGLWDGGSRESYSLVEIATGRAVPFPNQASAPWDANRQEIRFAIPAGFAVVRHSVFCGQDMGLRFTLRPEDAAPLLPAPIDLSHAEKVVLMATAAFKASYGGRDRYQMAADAMRYRTGAIMPSREVWEATKVRLAARGMLDKRGAITVAGRNAIGNERI